MRWAKLTELASRYPIYREYSNFLYFRSTKNRLELRYAIVGLEIAACRNYSIEFVVVDGVHLVLGIRHTGVRL